MRVLNNTYVAADLNIRGTKATVVEPTDEVKAAIRAVYTGGFAINKGDRLDVMGDQYVKYESQRDGKDVTDYGRAIGVEVTRKGVKLAVQNVSMNSFLRVAPTTSEIAFLVDDPTRLTAKKISDYIANTAGVDNIFAYTEGQQHEEWWQGVKAKVEAMTDTQIIEIVDAVSYKVKVSNDKGDFTIGYRHVCGRIVNK